MELRDFTLPVTVVARKCYIFTNRLFKVCEDGGRAADGDSCSFVPRQTQHLDKKMQLPRLLIHLTNMMM